MRVWVMSKVLEYAFTITCTGVRGQEKSNDPDHIRVQVRPAGSRNAVNSPKVL